MKRQSFLHCLLVLMFLAGAVSVTRTAAQAPQFAPATDPERFRFLDQDGITPVDSAPHAGTSYYTTVRNTDECEAVHSQRGAAYIAGCPPVTEPGYSFGSNPYLSDDRKFPVAYWRAGEKIYFRIKFTEDVQVDPNNLPTVHLDFDRVRRENENDPTADPITARLVPGEGTASDPTRDMLTFVYTVKERDDCLGDGVNVPVDGQYGFQHNTAGAIQDLNGNNFDFSATSARLREVFDIYYGGLGSTLQEAAFRGIRFGIDTYPSSVRITGLIIREPALDATHDERGARIDPVNFEDITPNLLEKKGVSPHPDDPSSRVEESTVQTAAFDIEIRFFNYGTGDGDGVSSDEPQRFEAQDIKIADASSGTVLSDWEVSHPKFIGQDHRDPGDWMDDGGADSALGDAKNSAAFLVYEARITPPNGFDGTVNIFLEEGATLDIAGNLSLKSNVFTVPVRTPPTVQVARRGGETGVITEAFAVDFQFSRDVVSPFDTEKIHITQADGTALNWDVAVSQPTSPSATVRAVVTPAFNFDGKVHITLEAGAVKEAAAVDDTVAVPEYLSNAAATEALVVTVDTVPPRVTETPKIVETEEEVYTAEDELIVEVSFDEKGVTYVGDNPPYVVIYLGERVLANARHATWQRGSERGGSTIVPFAYPIQAGDFATSVSLDTSGILIPQGTRVVDGDGNELLGQAAPAIEPGAPVDRLPPKTAREDTLTFPTTQQEPPTFDISETPVLSVIYLPETSDPKAVASSVPRSPIVFNELGNGSGDTEDWLELRNVTGSAVSLKDWELSIVQDGKQEDTSLIAFVEDVSVPANGLLLLVNTSPDKTSLAGGDDISTADVEKKGSPHQYLVNSGLSLPDDGKFLLILRNASEKLGLNEAFVDVAGGGGSDTDAFVREQTGDYDTHVWPLQVLHAPGGDTEDALGSGKVWQRANAGVVGYHKDAWAESAFTGLGYDRKVSESPATAGTPGYPNGAAKETAATPKGSVTLSEIMFDSGGGTLPQWIELYNNSKTDAINLNRWELEIQNVDSEDLIGRPIVTLTLGEKVIQPNQTLLIVAGPARASSDSYLPADRVYDLLALHDKNLRIKRARDTFLSTEGFYLKLTDRNENLVDEVGNRDSDRRSDDAPAWALPLSAEEGSRSSLIRRYDNGVALPGRKRASWVLASRIKPFDASLHYGHADDIGTPGHREGGALPVELSSFSLTRNEAGAVVLTWTTESEVDNAGFNLRRSEKRASGFTLLNPALIAGAGTTGERQMYTFTDTSAKPGIEYYYQIEEVAFDGKRETLVTRLLPGPVSASNRMLTTFGEVKKTK